jgi:hypothetical protein
MPQQYENHDEASANQFPLETVHAFSIGAFTENIAVRQNGQLLLTVATSGELWMLDVVQETPAPVLVHQFEQGIAGIVEMGKDQFFISSGILGQGGT